MLFPETALADYSPTMSAVVPAEWSTHRAMWVGFPSHPDLWEQNLDEARREVVGLIRALAGPGAEHVKVMTATPEAEETARKSLVDVPNVTIVPGDFGDIWLRDTGPIFTSPGEAVAFRFNGWGGKYDLPGDADVAQQVARHAGAHLRQVDFVLEGGALDHDGSGAVLTTRQCLLNANRNGRQTEAEVERQLQAALGATSVHWLEEGLMNDHTDGHVDNLARFVGQSVIACPVSFGEDDPNADVYDAVATSLATFRQRDGSPHRIVRVPSPGRVLIDGHVAPASHMNFLIANAAVVVPTYDDRRGNLAVEALEQVFPGRQVIGLSSRALLTGGGSFHCITQQEPA